VKGADVRFSAVIQERLQAHAHLVRGSIGKGDGEDSLRRDATVHNTVGNTMGDDAGLPTAGPRQYEKRAAGVLDGPPLLWIQVRQGIWHGGLRSRTF
jgi:hypothetical protein